MSQSPNQKKIIRWQEKVDRHKVERKTWIGSKQKGWKINTNYSSNTLSTGKMKMKKKNQLKGFNLVSYLKSYYSLYPSKIWKWCICWQSHERDQVTRFF